MHKWFHLLRFSNSRVLIISSHAPEEDYLFPLYVHFFNHLVFYQKKTAGEIPAAVFILV